MWKTNITLIKDPTNLVLAHRAKPPPPTISAHFEGPFILVEHVKRQNISTFVNMGEQRDDPKASSSGEGDTTTSALASASTF